MSKNITDKRMYSRSNGSILCIICKQYHQKKKNGKCNNIHSELSIITDFIKSNDHMYKNSTSLTTEVSIRRLFGLLYEHREEFKLWSKESNIELKAESYDLNTIVSEKVEDSITIKKRKLEVSTEQQETNRAPPLLSYEFLKSIPDIKLA